MQMRLTSGRLVCKVLYYIAGMQARRGREIAACNP